jgi:integrase
MANIPAQRVKTRRSGPPKVQQLIKGIRSPAGGQAFKGASVINRADGRLVARVTMSDGGHRYLSGKDGGEIVRRATELAETGDADRSQEARALTVGGWLREWLASLAVQTRSGKRLKASTIDYYTRYAEAHLLRSELAAKPLAKLETADLLRLYRRMTADPAEGGLGLSSTTAHHLHAVVHRALAKAVSTGKVASNVAAGVDRDDRPTVNHVEMTVLADADYDSFLAAVRGERLEALYVVAIREGLRQGEILGLHWRNVDLDGGALAVTGSLQGARRSSLTIGEPKSRKSVRALALFPETVEALREHRSRQEQERRRAGSMWADGDLVFPNEFGAYLSTTTLTRNLDGLLRRAGLPDVRFHDLRHSAATDWLRNGMHPKVASERLGHASVGITLDLYSHVTPTMQREAVAEITRKRSVRNSLPT